MNGAIEVTKKRILCMVLAVNIVTVILMLLSNYIFKDSPIIVFLSFSVNIVVFTGLIINSIMKHRFSFEFIHLFFMLFMLTLAPLIQNATTGGFLHYYATNLKIVITNSAFLMWTLFYYIGRYSNKKVKTYNVQLYNFKPLISQNTEYIMTFIMIVLAVNKIRVSGISIFRNSAAQTNFSGTGLNVLFFAIRISIVMVAVSISIYRYDCSKRISVTMIINLLLSLIIAFPTAIPRFLAATIYGGIILKIFTNLKRNYIYPIAILGGFIIVFPLFSNFRYASNNINLMELFKQVISNFKNEYNTGNYDGYMMFLRTVDYVDDYHVTFGYSLFGNCLFFIPRSIWPSKPVGSGAFIAEYSNFSFTNCSECLIAESYLNFGIIGIIVYAFVLGRITKKIDDIYWNDPNNIFIQLTYAFYIHVFLILMRGDFMTGFLYISILTLVFYFFYRMLGIKKGNIVMNMKTKSVISET